MAASRTRAAWLMIPLVLAGIVALFLLLILVAWAAWSTVQVSAIWPEDVAPLVAPEPALPVDPDARVRLDEMIARVPDTLDNSALGDALSTTGPPSDDLLLPDGLDPAITAMDTLLESSGLQMESWGFNDEIPPFLDVLALARARLVRSWRYTQVERSDEALAEMLRVARLGLMLEHGGGNLLSAMVGQAISDEALSEIVELVTWVQPPSDAMLAVLAAELEAAVLLPSGLEGAILGECRGAEGLLEDLRHQSYSELFATVEPGGLAESDAPSGMPGRECCFPFYDADRTIMLARQRCHTLAASSLQPGSQRQVPDWEPLQSASWLEPGTKLDNPVGRIMLDLATPSYAGFFDKVDRLRSRRALLVAWVGVQRHLRAHPEAESEAPASLATLVPSFLARVPTDPWDGAPVSYDPQQRVLWTTLGADVHSELRLEF